MLDLRWEMAASSAARRIKGDRAAWCLRSASSRWERAGGGAGRLGWVGLVVGGGESARGRKGLRRVVEGS